MRMSAANLYALLPAIYRIRDAEAGHPLRELIGVIAEQAAIVEESIEQLYDDQFIETCADWVAPYIGELIGYRPLHGSVPEIASPRAEIANTIGYRSRLGTACVLEQLARDVTSWPARVNEFFRTTATTQRMNHIRPGHHFAPDLRDWRGLENVGGAFDPFTRAADMRSIARADGRHNFPNIGIHLWRLRAFPRRRSPATLVNQFVTNQCFLFSPLGAPLPLFTNPHDEVSITHIATPLDVPAPISRHVLYADLKKEPGLPPPGELYGLAADGALQSLEITVGTTRLKVADVEACDLSDQGSAWAHMPKPTDRLVAIDPVLGRIAFPNPPRGVVTVTYHHGFSAPIGGGEYERGADFAPGKAVLVANVQPIDPANAGAVATIQGAINALPPEGGIVEIVDNGLYEETLKIDAGPGARIELRARNGFHPHVRTRGPFRITGAPNPDGSRDARVTIDGLLITGMPIIVPPRVVPPPLLPGRDNALEKLTLRHCTLVPGHFLDSGGLPMFSGQQSLIIGLQKTALEMSACITGPLGVVPRATASLRDSIVDAAAADPADSPQGVAYADVLGTSFGGALTLRGVTVFGKIAAERFDLVSDSILDARLAPGDTWPAAVRAERRQVGCMRFSFVPRGSIVPRRYRCQPQLAIDTEMAARTKELGGPVGPAERAAIVARATQRIVPSFTSRRYGRPAYAQLRRGTPIEIRAGASDESEMGGFHLVFAPQRETNLRIRIDEYLRFALEAGAFFET
ncbi:MAG: hypothetical protein QOH47_1752 [Sphingomonadales bacterium]|nr:hypothetical protein [Sphingomonadales bacterium]